VLLISVGALAGGLSGCKDLDTCAEPGGVEACPCPGSVFGARTCLPEQIWGDCDCSVEGPLPDSGTPGMTGGVGGSATGGAGGMTTGGMDAMTGGVGGVGGDMTGGVGGMTGGSGGMDDSGMAMPDASDDAGGMAGVGG
jgi:hypothetical protein